MNRVFPRIVEPNWCRDTVSGCFRECVFLVPRHVKRCVHVSSVACLVSSVTNSSTFVAHRQKTINSIRITAKALADILTSSFVLVGFDIRNVPNVGVGNKFNE